MSRKRKAPSGGFDRAVEASRKRSRLRKPGKGINKNAIPIRSIPRMFETMFLKAVRTDGYFAYRVGRRRPLNLVVATVCSGTDAPLTALSLLQEACRLLIRKESIMFRHQFSCEIEPFKQAFIRRNHNPPIIFRNVVELGANGAVEAMEASGSLVMIPTEKIDLLVAGTSCVDFSALNNRKDQKTKVQAFNKFSKEDLAGDTVSSVGLDQDFRDAVHDQLSPKGLESIGESMTTFLSTLNFIMDRRPRIVIFENVQTAPWKAMQNFWLPRAGYAAKFAKVNSKDFYIPQDRIRGYLVAMDAEEFDGCGSGSTAAMLVHQAIELLPAMKQRASSSVLDFLLEDDDPDLLQARDEIAHCGVHGLPQDPKRANSNRQIDWDFCKLRHLIYSQRWNLDTIRRFSKATLSHGRIVSISPPANSWIEYWDRETPRVIDLFDNLYQQFLTRGDCDMNFKAAMFNISQNLDRMPINLAKLGIAPIITPAGMPTLSSSARPLLGVECLTLQGIPKSHLRLAGESHRELRDLAGNAMTTTVVGAVILATLMAADRSLARIHRATNRARPVFTSNYVELVSRCLKDVSDWDLGDFRLDASSMLTYGGLRVCRCPLVGSHRRVTFRCRDCGKPACQLCKANPQHNFERYDYSNRVIHVADLKAHVQQCLPGVFKMKMQEDAKRFFNLMVKRSDRSHYFLCLRELLSDNDFYFAGVKVSVASVIVEYRSRQNIARLMLTRTGGAAWYIFPTSEPLGISPVGVRERGETPIARASIDVQRSTVDPEAALWCFWEPVKHSWLAKVTVKKEHCFILDHTTIETLSSPPSHLETRVRETILGVWYANPQCGTPEDSLYIRRAPGNEQKAFLFKDVDPIGHPIFDKLIISKDVDLAGTQDYTGDEVTVELLKVRDMRKTVRISVPGYWQPIEPLACFQTSVHSAREEDYLHLASCATIADDSTESCCAMTPLILVKLSVQLANLPFSIPAKQRWTDRWHNVPATELDGFFRSVLFTANVLEKGYFFKPEPDLSFDPGRGVPVKLCTDCCVEPPQLHWVKGDARVVPWEDPTQVRAYEARVKTMPDPFTARVRLDPHNDLLHDPYQPPPDDSRLFVHPRRFKSQIPQDIYHKLGLLLAVNPRTLASRAAANLAYGFRPRRYSPEILGDVQCSFQVEVGVLLGPNVRFDRFYDSIPTTEDNTGLRNVEPAGDLCIPSFQSKGHRLREDQARSVKWMMAREKEPAPYLETETEEQVFEAFNLRIIGRATYPNDGSAFCCRGGIVAHEIGYGKTVVMIALLELRRGFDVALSMVKRAEAACKFWESELSFMHLKATLVIVPDHITAQWRDEFGKFGSNARVLVLERYADLLKTPLSALEEADVIIVAVSMFKASAYTTSLNLLLEDRPTGLKSDREAEDRYRSSLETIRLVVRRYRELQGNASDADKENGALDRAKEVLVEKNQNYQDLCRRWTSAGGRRDANRRQRQTKKTGVENMDGAARTRKLAEPKHLWTATRFLENFSFARIIVDEFSYENPGVTLFFTNALANAKWLLSGTPRCGNLADIVHLGRLLSVHVARPDPCIPTYLDSITLGPHNKPTAPSEEYRLRVSHLRSHNFALDRHRAGEAFIRHFMRQDKVNMDKFDLETKKIELDLPTLSRVAYGGLQHDLSVAKGNVFNLPFSLRQFLRVATTFSYAGDNVSTGTQAADALMARFAAVPITASTLQGLLGACDLDVLTLKDEMKTALDKLLWLCHRAPLVSKLIRDQYPRHHNMRTLIGDIFTAMADARDSWVGWPMAPYGGRDAYYQLAKALCPTSAFKYQQGGLENWTKWRYSEAKSFWPDWYDLPESYIDGLFSPEKREELVELSTDVILLNISHPLGRSFARSGEGPPWLDSHAKVLGRIMDERTRVNFLSTRQASAVEQARAAAVRDTVPKFSTEQLIKFLKDCMEEKRKAFDPEGVTKQKIAEKGKQALQRHCLHRNLRFSDSNSALQLAEKVLTYVQGRCTKKDFIDKRGVISPRAEFPIPNQTFEKRGGKTEATLEELTVTYNYFMNCREAWIDSFRRLRLYNLLRFIQYSQYEKSVDKYCDACLRRPVCVGDVPGFIVLACGHWLCEEHKRVIDKDGEHSFCPAMGCGAPCGLSHPTTIKMTEGDVLGSPDVWEAEGEARCSEGGKIEGIVSLITEIPKDDKVIIFTYIEELAVAVRDKLVLGGVSVLSMVATGSDAALAEILEDFKRGSAKVLIIDPTAEHAAGSNLTITNHVIFASPILERDAFLRQMHYRQAVGRCLREGQKKKVTIYTFVTKGTIDEELYNAQELDNVMK